MSDNKPPDSQSNLWPLYVMLQAELNFVKKHAKLAAEGFSRSKRIELIAAARRQQQERKA